MIPEAFKQSFFDDSLSSPKIARIYDVASQKYRVREYPTSILFILFKKFPEVSYPFES
jgi:hypothetical protein